MSIHNKKNPSLPKRVWLQLSSENKVKLLLLLLLVVFSSFAEVLSIGAVIPFLSILTNPELVTKNSYFDFIVTDDYDISLYLTVLFALLIVLSGSIKILTLHIQTKVSFGIGKEFSREIYRKTLYQPYSVHTSRNTSEIISGITIKAGGLIYSGVMPLLTIISSGILLLLFISAFILIKPTIVIYTLLGFGTIYTSITYFSKKRLKKDSEIINNESNNIFKILQEGLGGIRDVLLDGTQESYVKIYRKADNKYRQSQSNVIILSQTPRFAVEALAIAFIAILAYTLNQNSSSGVITAVPLLGALALGAQRVLPIVQQSFQSWTIIQSNKNSLIDTLDLIEQPMPLYLKTTRSNRISFKRDIKFNNVSFKYDLTHDDTLKKLCLTINKGDKIGITGTTGSGKSTFLDLLMFLLTPSNGQIEIDDVAVNEFNYRSWQSNIAHVPQFIFLTDATIIENIAFGVERDDIDLARVIKSAEKAQISSTIDLLPKKYDTVVGERGIRLSGGQRQRIGIARALYKKAKVIILDEATSSLDNNTEIDVMAAIEKLDKNLTIIIVAHRTTTLKNCNYIIKFNEGKIIKTGTYEELFK